jgi:hypothetical protein
MAFVTPVSTFVSCGGSATRRLAVPARYAAVMRTPETQRARGRLRLGSRISSPRNEADSTPPNANAIVAKKSAPLREPDGAREARVIAVAGPP